MSIKNDQPQVGVKRNSSKKAAASAGKKTQVPLDKLLIRGAANISHDAISGVDRSFSLIRLIDMVVPPSFPLQFPRFFFCPEFSIVKGADISEVKFVIELENPKKKVFALGDLNCSFLEIPVERAQLVRFPLEIARTFTLNSFGEYIFRLVAIRGEERMIVAEKMLQVIQPQPDPTVKKKK